MNQDYLPPNDPGPQPGASDHLPEQVPIARPVHVGGEIPIARPLSTEPPGDHNPMRLERVSPWICVLNLLAIVPVFFLCSLIYGVVISAREGFDPEDPAAGLTIMDMVPVGMATAIIMLVVLCLERVPLSAIGLTGLNRRSAALNALLGFAASVIAFGLFALSVIVMRWVWPAGADQFEDNTQNIDRMIPRIPPLTLLAVMACVSLYEEIIFRGILLTHLRRLLRSWTAAVLIVGITFGLVHIGGAGSQVLAAAVPLGLVGIAWSIITIWRRSLAPVVIGHMLFNFVQILILFQMAPEGVPAFLQAVCGGWVTGLGRTLASALGFC